MPNMDAIAPATKSVRQRSFGDRAEDAMEDFFKATAQAALADPLDALRQLVNHSTPLEIKGQEKLVELDKNFWTKSGRFVGQAFDYVFISKMTAGIGAPGLAGSFMRGAAGGAILGALTPVSEEGNFWLNKGKVMTLYAGTFGTISGAGDYLGKLSCFGNGGARTFWQEVGLGAASGAPGGLVNAELGHMLYKKGHAGARDLGIEALGYAAFGALVSAGQFALQRQIDYGRGAKAEYAIDVDKNKIKFTDAEGNPVYVTCGKDGKPIKVQFDTANGYKEMIYTVGKDAAGNPNWELSVLGNGLGLAGRRTAYVWEMPTDAAFNLHADGRGLSMKYRATNNPNWPQAEIIQPGASPFKMTEIRLPAGTDFVKGRLSWSYH